MRNYKRKTIHAVQLEFDDLDKCKKRLNTEEMGKLIFALFEYAHSQIDGTPFEEPCFDSGYATAMFDVMSEKIKENQINYKNACMRKAEGKEKAEEYMAEIKSINPEATSDTRYTNAFKELKKMQEVDTTITDEEIKITMDHLKDTDYSDNNGNPIKNIRSWFSVYSGRRQGKQKPMREQTMLTHGDTYDNDPWKNVNDLF